MTVTVVIPTRNRRGLLERAVRCVLGQQSADVELVVVDDASDDDTPGFLSGLGDARVHVVRHDSPRGVAAARNAGLARASSEWTAFLDDDDLWAPDKLAAQIDALAANPASRWSCVAAVDVDERLHLVEPQAQPESRSDIVSELLAVNVVPGGGSGVLADTELIRSVGGFDEELRILADWDAWIRLALASPVTVVERPLLAYLRHEASMTTGVPAIRAELDRVAAKYARERAARGVEIGWRHWLPYIASMQRRAGQRAAPAAGYARLAILTRNPAWLLRAAGALARPGGVGPLRRRGRRPIPPEWREEVERWLRPIREQAAAR